MAKSPMQQRYAKLLWLSLLEKPKKLSEAYKLWKNDLMRRQTYRILNNLYKNKYIETTKKETKLLYFSTINKQIIQEILIETNLLPPEINKDIPKIIKFLNSDMIRQNFFSKEIINLFFKKAEDEWKGQIKPFDLISLCITTILVNYSRPYLKTEKDRVALNYSITAGEQIASKDRVNIEEYDSLINRKIKQNKELQNYLEGDGRKITRIILNTIKERTDKMYYYNKLYNEQ